MIQVINIGGRIVNSYILLTEKGCVVIDTGYEHSFKNFSRKLSENGLSFSEINYIFLTHAHDDHAGFLGELLSATKAPVILHYEAVKRLLAGRNPIIGGCSTRLAWLFCRGMALAGKGKHEFPPVDVTGRAIIIDGHSQPLKEVGIPTEIIMLPGHTSDSIGLLLEDGRLFCGDAAMNNFPSIARHIIWIEDLESYIKSWDLMMASKANTICPSHGKPFPVSDLHLFRNYMVGKRLYSLK